MRKVQVILSSYNGEKYIRQQIDSILEQKDVEVKLLVRDDGSTDNTPSILEEYEKKELISVIYGCNIGIYKSFMTLLDYCEMADYYAFSDQDDVWLDDKLISAIIQLENKSKDIPLLYCSALQRVDEQLNAGKIQKFVGLKTNIYSALVRERLAGCTFVINNTLKYLLKGSSKLNIDYAHDSWTVLVCYACGGNVVYDETPHILFRRYGTNASIDGGNIKKRIEHEFRYFSRCRNQRYEVVKELLEFQKDKVVEQDFLNEILSYKKGIHKTVELAFNRNLDCGIKISNLITRIAILARCF